MALPTALFAMVAGLALASAAVLSSVDVQQGSTRDHDSKEAIAAADAGAGVALLRLNRFQSSLSLTNPCAGPAGEPQTPTTGWCPSTQVESVGGATYTYRVSAYASTKALTVVAVGTSGTVSRRVSVGLIGEGGQNVFADEKLIGQENIVVKGNAHINTDIGTNGNIEGNGNPTLCGNVRHGIGKTAFPPSCGKSITEGEKELPPVVAPTDIATNNWDCRLAATILAPNCLSKSNVDTYIKVSGKKEQDKRTAKEPWEATPKNLNVKSEGTTLTMGGLDYLVCKINVQNGNLIMAGGASMRIFVDTPEHCGLESGATQVEITGGNITSTGYIPTQGSYSVPGIYLLGNGAVKLGGNAGTNELILYAPESDITMDGNAEWIGLIAGKTLNIPGTPTIKSDPNITPPNYTVASLLRRTRYVECTGASASTPNGNC